MPVLGGVIVAVAGVIVMRLGIWGLYMLFRGDLVTRRRQHKKK